MVLADTVLHDIVTAPTQCFVRIGLGLGAHLEH